MLGDLSHHIETEEETDGRWIAEITDITGVMAHGATREEAPLPNETRLIYLSRLS
jgi:hypothetical protein